MARLLAALGMAVLAAGLHLPGPIHRMRPARLASMASSRASAMGANSTFSFRRGGADYVSHEAIVSRVRSDNGRKLPIQQPERYTSKDWLHNLRNWGESGLLKRIRHPVGWLTAWAAVVTLVDFGLRAGGLGRVYLSARPHTMLGSALSLLLVFRTNAAYQRFQHGRRVWEDVTTASRATARAIHYYAPAIGEPTVSRLHDLLSCFPILLQERVQGEAASTLSERLSTILHRHADLDRLDCTPNRPLFVLSAMATDIQKLGPCLEHNFEGRDRLKLHGHVDSLEKTIAAAEAIVQTPVPLKYARHTSRFLTLFILTVPVSLVTEIGFATVPVVALMSWALIGIQEIGLIIEDPFRRVLKLDVIVSEVAQDITATVYPRRWAGKTGNEPLATHVNEHFEASVPVATGSAVAAAAPSEAAVDL